MQRIGAGSMLMRHHACPRAPSLRPHCSCALALSMLAMTRRALHSLFSAPTSDGVARCLNAGGWSVLICAGATRYQCLSDATAEACAGRMHWLARMARNDIEKVSCAIAFAEFDAEFVLVNSGTNAMPFATQLAWDAAAVTAAIVLHRVAPVNHHPIPLFPRDTRVEAGRARVSARCPLPAQLRGGQARVRPPPIASGGSCGLRLVAALLQHKDADAQHARDVDDTAVEEGRQQRDGEGEGGPQHRVSVGHQGQRRRDDEHPAAAAVEPAFPAAWSSSVARGGLAHAWRGGTRCGAVVSSGWVDVVVVLSSTHPSAWPMATSGATASTARPMKLGRYGWSATCETMSLLVISAKSAPVVK